MQKINTNYAKLSDYLRAFSELTKIDAKTLKKSKEILFYIIKNNNYEPFNFDLSLKLSKDKQDIIPSFRATHYIGYNQASKKNIFIQSGIRKESIKNLFKKHGLSNKENNKIIDYFFNPCFKSKFALPVQFGYEIKNNGEIIFKIFKSCSWKFNMILTKEGDLIEEELKNNCTLNKQNEYFKNLLNKYFRYSENELLFLNKEHIGIIAVGFKKSIKGAKIYLICGNEKELVKKLEFYKFDRLLIDALSMFLRKNNLYLRREAAICLDTKNKTFYPKKIDFYLKNEYLGNMVIIKRLVSEMGLYFGYLQNKSIYDNVLGKNIYSFSVGDNFLTFYYGYGIWSLENIFIN